MIFKEGTKLYSILRMKCPRCHVGNLFTYKNPYNIRHIGDMPAKCPNCGQDFSPEPGFYFGAAYVSYALNVAVFIGVFFFLYIGFNITSLWVMMLAILAVSIVLLPLFFRLSRAAWINFFVSYQPNLNQE